ncbi:hypothetical protein ACLX1H_010254 [Fusarium chlamydosporum]
MIPVLVPALEETVDGLGESTSVDEAASEAVVLSTEALLLVDEIASKVEVGEIASKIEVLSAEVTWSVEEVGIK